MEKLSKYFKKTQGLGVLSTADKKGKVNAALYARPHFMNDETAAFIMADRLTHRNIQENPKAVYLFVENSKDYTGKRLYLTKTRESEDPSLIESLRRKKSCCPALDGPGMKKSFLVYFRVDSVLPLVGEKAAS